MAYIASTYNFNGPINLMLYFRPPAAVRPLSRPMSSAPPVRQSRLRQVRESAARFHDLARDAFRLRDERIATLPRFFVGRELEAI